MTKIILNQCFGGFTLSEAQQKLMGASSPYEDVDRLAPELITSVEAGDTGGEYAKLVVIEIPDEAHYDIVEYNGYENIFWSLSEIHRV